MLYHREVLLLNLHVTITFYTFTLSCNHLFTSLSPLWTLSNLRKRLGFVNHNFPYFSTGSGIKNICWINEGNLRNKIILVSRPLKVNHIKLWNKPYKCFPESLTYYFVTLSYNELFLLFWKIICLAEIVRRIYLILNCHVAKCCRKVSMKYAVLKSQKKSELHKFTFFFPFLSLSIFTIQILVMYQERC